MEFQQKQAKLELQKLKIEIQAYKSEIKVVDSFRNKITTEACDRMIGKLTNELRKLEGELYAIQSRG